MRIFALLFLALFCVEASAAGNCRNGRCYKQQQTCTNGRCGVVYGAKVVTKGAVQTVRNVTHGAVNLVKPNCANGKCSLK